MILYLLIILLASGLGRQIVRAVMRSVRRWLAETHSLQFELCRHFFSRFFDSEFIASPEQAKTVAGGALAILISLSLIYAPSYYHKYRMLLETGDVGMYQRAELADVLFVITLVMTIVGLFTTLQWPSLFPGLRDYLALASLPARMRDVFAAKFAALLGFAALAILATVTLPSVILPATMAERPLQIAGIFCSCSLAALFVFFSLVTIQGVLLNVIPVRQFPRVSLLVQAVLLSALLCGLPFVFSIPDLHTHMTQRPPWALWAPPLWFLGLDQWLLGSAEPFTGRLARIGATSVVAAAATAVLTYVWSYRHHRTRVLETPELHNNGRRGVPSKLADSMLPDPRTLAVFAFTAKTLARSRHHRLILTAFAAIALAIICEGFASLALSSSGISTSSAVFRQTAIAAPLALSLFILAGFRYLFRLPVELRANWIFRIHQPGNAAALLAGVEHFVVFCGVIPIFVLTLPIEMRLLGARAGMLVSVMCLLLSSILVEILMFSFEKIPFTSSYLPGRHPLIETVLRYGVAAILYVSMLSSVVRLSLATPASSALMIVALLAVWWKTREARLRWQQVERLEFEEAPEPAVQVLSIDRD